MKHTEESEIWIHLRCIGGVEGLDAASRAAEHMLKCNIRFCIFIVVLNMSFVPRYMYRDATAVISLLIIS